MNMPTVKRTELGWPGHFCAAEYCLFRRNTLLDLEGTDVRIVVSTVGHHVDPVARREGRVEMIEVSPGRHFETLAFHAYLEDGRYWDADVHRQVRIDGTRNLPSVGMEIEADAMHEAVVEEITSRLLAGALD